MAGKEATAESLVESVLHPSKVIKKGYESVTVVTADGRTITGLAAEETADTLTLIDPAANGKKLAVAKADIETRSALSQSLMPEGLINILSDGQQFLDLTKYLIEVAEGGAARAKELRPTVTVLVIPEYEKQIDHAGLISKWDAKSLKRGEAMSTRVCANRHGALDRPARCPRRRSSPRTPSRTAATCTA